MQSNRDNQQHHGSFPNLQYYEITRQSSDASITDSLQPSSHTSSSDNANAHQRQAGHGSTAHLHPINMCAGASLVSQGIIPGSVFGDGSHLHYHIYPSRRVMNCPEASSDQQGCRSHSRLEQIHHHEQHHHEQQQQQHHQHYPRQPRTTMMRPPTRLDELAKERGRQTPQSNFDNLSRYPLGHKMHDKVEKTKNIALMELSSDSQATITSTKGKCQCHTLHQQPLRLKRDGVDGDDGIADGNREDRQPPALPPRPPPRPSSRRYELPTAVAAEQRHVGSGGGVGSSGGGGCCKKYVVLCWLCGGLSAAVGSLFFAVHVVLFTHTDSLALFETVPSYIPGAMLIFMGFSMMLLARRKHRYGYLMKVCGSMGIVCALMCVLVTVTTTVVHMSRLQGLRECVYTARARSCTCYGAPQSRASDPGVLFEGTPHCEAVHGTLYACLRALFGVSVAGILACIFSCMLVYQLISHERKKMYWEQLELRCRSLYGPGAGPAFDERVAGSCGCCNDCGGIGPWWAQSPGNLYTPNPDLAPSRRWRLPWSRSRGPAPSADSNYGFASSGAGVSGGNGPGGMSGNQVMGPHHQSDHHGGLMDHGGLLQPYSILGPQSAGAYSVLQAGHPHPHDDPYAQNNGASPYSVLEAAVPLWGPPPPYSDPNSPARRPMLAFPSADPRSRLSKRIDNFPLRDVECNRSPDIKRPSGNYENAEQVSNDTDTDTVGNSEGRVTRGSSKHKKLLKGVENAAFQQQESSSIPKQSESELYFGDVSSCCGPESSLYDVATEKDGKSEGCQLEAGTSYLPSSQFTKRPSSKRSRRQQQQQQQQQQISPVHLHRDNELLADQPSHSSCSSAGDEPPAAVASSSSTYSMNTTADIEYEVIRQQQQQLQQQQQQQQQRRFGYDSSRPENANVPSVYSEKQQKQPAEAEAAAENRASESDDGAYGADEEVDERDDEERDFKDYRSSSYEEDIRPVNV